MANPQSKNQLHGIKIEVIVTKLVEQFQFEVLRQNPWARKKLEDLFLKPVVK